MELFPEVERRYTAQGSAVRETQRRRKSLPTLTLKSVRLANNTSIRRENKKKQQEGGRGWGKMEGEAEEKTTDMSRLNRFENDLSAVTAQLHST